jgi:hypothetical protein
LILKYLINHYGELQTVVIEFAVLVVTQLPDDVTELFEVHVPLKHDCEVVNAWDTSIKENALDIYYKSLTF